jgi:hypothetical protein
MVKLDDPTYHLERRDEYAVQPWTIQGLPKRYAFVKVENSITSLMVPIAAHRTAQPAFVPRYTDEEPRRTVVIPPTAAITEATATATFIPISSIQQAINLLPPDDFDANALVDEGVD